MFRNKMLQNYILEGLKVFRIGIFDPGLCDWYQYLLSVSCSIVFTLPIISYFDDTH